jgi:hypothetical protein
MVPIPQDETLVALLARHLDLLKEQIPYNLSLGLAEARMHNRCTNLLVDLILNQRDAAYQLPLYESLQDLQQRKHLSAQELQLRAVQLVQEAI